MLIYCVRHGHAELTPNAQGERPLTQQGIRDVTKVADFLSQKNIHVSHVMHSEKQRAVSTAAIFSRAIAANNNLEKSALLNPDKAITPLSELLQSWNDDTMLVGHLPFMSHLVSALTIGDEDHDIIRFTPSTVVCLERYDNYRWIVNWVLRPSLLLGA